MVLKMLSSSKLVERKVCPKTNKNTQLTETILCANKTKEKKCGSVKEAIFHRCLTEKERIKLTLSEEKFFVKIHCYPSNH